MDEKTIWITSDDGKEIRAEILFTFENEETGKKYVLVSLPGNDDEVYPFTYTDDGELNAVENEEELEMCEEVLGSFVEEDLV